jgi:hypothetical protein
MISPIDLMCGMIIARATAHSKCGQPFPPLRRHKKNFMENDIQGQTAGIPQDSAMVEIVPKSSENFGTVQNTSEPIGKVRNDADAFRSVPRISERKKNHSLTIRDVARLFETAGVARTERSIVNWCQPNRQGICRLDCYFDPNERKYYLTPQSVERVIAEEKARATKANSSSESGMPSVTIWRHHKCHTQVGKMRLFRSSACTAFLASKPEQFRRSTPRCSSVPNNCAKIRRSAAVEWGVTLARRMGKKFVSHAVSSGRPQQIDRTSWAAQSDRRDLVGKRRTKDERRNGFVDNLLAISYMKM